MEEANKTVITQFFLLGVSDDPALQSLIFSIFLTMYLVTILGNLLIILAIVSEKHLQSPMYFFLSNLSFTDICLGTTTIPKMLINIQAQDKSITYTGCLTQICFFWNFAFFENCLLAIMAFDRYVAICHPLSYTVTMNPQFCGLLILLSQLSSIMIGLLLSLLLLELSFCTELFIHNFFCDLAEVIKLACSDPLINYILTYAVAFIFGGTTLSGIIYSYIQIVSSVLRKPSQKGRYKAFSTCGSHLLVVCLFYGTAFGVYISSAVTDSPRKTAVASLMYSVVPQMMNPFIYSLRNRDMKEALKKVIGRISSIL